MGMKNEALEVKCWKFEIYGNVSAKCQEKTCAVFKVRDYYYFFYVNISLAVLCFQKTSRPDIFVTTSSFSVNSISH